MATGRNFFLITAILCLIPISVKSVTISDTDFSAGLFQSSVSVAGNVLRISSTDIGFDGKWLNGWKYRRAININNSLSYGLSDYQVWIPTSIFGPNWTDIRSKAQPTMADFRFTPSTATSTLPYWIEDNTSAPKGFWVKISISTGVNTIYMYYGNQSAVSASSGSEVFDAFDDFEDGTISSNWTIVPNSDSGAWQESSGTLKITSSGTPRTIKYTAKTFENFILEYKQKRTDSGTKDWVGSLIRTVNPQDQFSNSGYLIYSERVGSTTTARAKIFTPSTPLGTSANTFDDSVFRFWQVIATTGNITVNVYNERLGISTATVSVSTPSTSGYIGLNGYSALGEFDNFIVRKYAPVEPQVTSIGPQETPYYQSGVFQSKIFDSGGNLSWGNLSWEENLQPQTSIKVRTRTGETSSPDDSWSVWSEYITISTGTKISSPAKRYLQYEATLETLVSTSTPELSKVSVSYTPLLPQRVAKLNFGFARDNNFFLSWDKVNTYENGMVSDYISGYNVYRATAPGKFEFLGFVPQTTNYFESQILPDVTYYYTVRSTRYDGTESVNSDVISLYKDSENKFISLPVYNFKLTVPNKVADEMAGSGFLISVATKPVSENEKRYSNIFLSFQLGNMDSVFSQPFTFETDFEPPEDIENLTPQVFYYNGANYILVNSSYNSDSKKIVARTNRSGNFVVRVVEKATQPEIVSIYPKKIFTPQAPSDNKIHFVISNPTATDPEGTVYDMNLRYVSKLKFENSELIWDGKYDSGEFVPKGIYIYKINIGNKIFTGTVIVAK